MNSNLKIQRVIWLLKADWIEHKKKVLYALGIFVALFILIVWLAGEQDRLDYVSPLRFFYQLGTFFTFLYYCRFVQKKIHFGKGIYLTLPASSFEKFGVLIAEGLMMILAYNLLFWGILAGWKLLFPEHILPYWHQTFHLTHGIGFFMFVTTLLFLAHLTFKRHAVAITFISLLTIFGLFVGLIYLAIPRYENMNIEELPILHFLVYYNDVIFCLFSLGILYLAYVKLKRKELK